MQRAIGCFEAARERVHARHAADLATYDYPQFQRGHIAVFAVTSLSCAGV